MRRTLVLILSIFSLQVFANDPYAVYYNDEALSRLKEENHYLSYKALLQALEADPLNPVLQYNLGVIFMANEEFAKAQKQFELSDQLTQDPELDYLSRFAAGIAATQAKNIDKALEFYQSALEIKPDSEDVKKNIELLWQGGGGEGEDDQQQDQQGEQQKQGEQGDKGEQKDPNDGKDQGQQPAKNKPQPFKSKELTPDQVRKILEELKAQEQKIRAEEYGDKGKDAPNEKDW